MTEGRTQLGFNSHHVRLREPLTIDRRHIGRKLADRTTVRGRLGSLFRKAFELHDHVVHHEPWLEHTCSNALPHPADHAVEVLHEAVDARQAVL